MLNKKIKGYKYSIIKKDEDDFKNSTILKKGITAEITIRELESMEKEVRKQLKEATAQYTLEDAKVGNIEHNHPYVMDFSDQQLFTIHMYAEAKRNSKKYKDYATRTEASLLEFDEEMADMYEKLGVIPTPHGEEATE